MLKFIDSCRRKGNGINYLIKNIKSCKKKNIYKKIEKSLKIFKW